MAAEQGDNVQFSSWLCFGLRWDDSNVWIEAVAEVHRRRASGHLWQRFLGRVFPVRVRVPLGLSTFGWRPVVTGAGV